jgi:hypothetical protein
MTLVKLDSAHKLLEKLVGYGIRRLMYERQKPRICVRGLCSIVRV